MRAELDIDCQLTIYYTSPAEAIALKAWLGSRRDVLIEEDKEPPKPVALLPPVAPVNAVAVSTIPTPAQPPGGPIVVYRGKTVPYGNLNEEQRAYYNNPNVMMDRGASPEALEYHASLEANATVPPELQGDQVDALTKREVQG